MDKVDAPDTDSCTAKRSTGRPRRLSRAAIIEAATRVIDDLGRDALSMRALARQLDVAPGTIYTYFDHIDDIADAAAAKLTADMPVPKVDSESPLRDQLVAMYTSLFSALMRHPGVGTTQGPLTRARVEQQYETVLAVLTSAGVELERAFTVHKLIVSLCAQEARLAYARLADAEDRKTTRQRYLAAGLPLIAAAQALPMRRLPPDQAFDYWARQLVDLLLPELAGNDPPLRDSPLPDRNNP